MRTLIVLLFIILYSATAFSKDSDNTGLEQEVPDIAGEDNKISPFDLLDISVFQEPDLNKLARVSRDGFISFPLIGKIKIAGLDVISAEEKIAGLLEKDYLVNPQVTIFVKEYRDRKVFVLGEVKRPGSYNIPPEKELTVLEAITMAGGFTDSASRDKTKIIRLEDGVQKHMEVRIDEIISRGNKSKDVILKSNDTIFVPQRLF